MTSHVSPEHPAARARGGHLVGTARALEPLLDRGTGPNWSVALATLAVRGSQGRTRESFAAAYGVGVEVVEALENGQVPFAQIPAPLLVLTPMADVLAGIAAGQDASAA